MMTTRTVTLTVTLPSELADQAKELETSDPEMLARIVSHGLLRLIVYGRLRESDQPFGSGFLPTDPGLSSLAKEVSHG